MEATSRTLDVLSCDHCHARFLPRPGACPRCGSSDIHVQEIPAISKVLAATELAVPRPGWPPAHRIALVEAVEGLRIIAEVRGPLPRSGDLLETLHEGERYVVRLLSAQLTDPLRPTGHAGRGNLR